MSFRDNYKTRLCNLFVRGVCDRVNCTFAHGEEELRKGGFAQSGKQFGHRRFHQSPPPEYFERRRRYSPTIRKRGRSRSPERSYEDYSDRSFGSRSPSPSFSSEERYRDRERKRDRRLEGDRSVDGAAASVWAELEEEKRAIMKDIGVKSEHLGTLQNLLDRKRDLAEELTAHASLLEKEIVESETAVNKVSVELKKLLKAQHRVVTSQDDVKRLQSKLQKLVAEIAPDDAGPYSVALPPREQPIAVKAPSDIKGRQLLKASSSSPGSLAPAVAVTPAATTSKEVHTKQDVSDGAVKIFVVRASLEGCQQANETTKQSAAARVVASSSCAGRFGSSKRDADGGVRSPREADMDAEPKERASYRSRHHPPGGRSHGAPDHQQETEFSTKDEVSADVERRGWKSAGDDKRRSFGKVEEIHGEKPDALLSKERPSKVNGESGIQVNRPSWTESSSIVASKKLVDKGQAAAKLAIDQQTDATDGATKDDAPKVSMKFSREGFPVKRVPKPDDAQAEATCGLETEKAGRRQTPSREVKEDGEVPQEDFQKPAEAPTISSRAREKKPLFPIRDTGRAGTGRSGQPSLLQKHQLQVQEQLRQTQAAKQQVEIEKAERMRTLMAAEADAATSEKMDQVTVDGKTQEESGNEQLSGGPQQEQQQLQVSVAQNVDESAPKQTKDTGMKIGHGKLIQPRQVLKGQQQQASTEKSQKVVNSSGKTIDEPVSVKEVAPKQFEYKYHFKPEDRFDAPPPSQQYPLPDDPYSQSGVAYAGTYSMDSSVGQQAYMGAYGVEAYMHDPSYVQPENPSLGAGLYYGEVATADVAAAPGMQLEECEPNPPGMDNDDEVPPGEERPTSLASLDLFGGAEVACGAALHYTSEFYDSCCRDSAVDEKPEFPHPLSTEV